MKSFAATGLALLVSAGVAKPVESEPPRDLPALMDLLSKSGGIRSSFEEVRHLRILARPIESEGLLYFAPPGQLARHTTRPNRSSVLVDDDKVVIGDESGRRKLPFKASKVAEALVTNLMIVFRGDLEALRAAYDIGFDADDVHWVLVLEPRDRSVRSVIERIRFTGTGRLLTRMDTFESNGDHTATTFHDTQTGVDWSGTEKERAFSLQPFEPQG